MPNLSELLTKGAEKAVADGITREMLDDHPGGNVHRWCAQNIKYRPDSEFFVVFLICGAIADHYARLEGYENNADRAAKIAFSKWENKNTVRGLPARHERVAN